MSLLGTAAQPALHPLDSVEFAELLAALAPGPHLAVATSGGADSMALALLAAGWARQQGARQQGAAVTALTIDHGLRAGSAAEAGQVAAWLRSRGIAHAVLAWQGTKPRHGIQAAAREARYRLLTDWCHAHRVADLVLAHHQDDQAETYLMRLARGSGPTGLAAMAAVTVRDGVRLLRPFLGIPKERLRATLRAHGQEWIEDPANADPRYGRTAVRQSLVRLAAEGVPAAHFAETARAFGRARAAEERATGALLARHATLDPAGFCWLGSAGSALTPGALTPAALAHVLGVVGGRPFPPEREALARLHGWAGSATGGSRTLHGCILTKRAGRLLICREARTIGASTIAIGEEIRWDNRFLARLASGDPGVRYEVGGLGAANWPGVRARATRSVPYPAVPSLPALFAGGRVVAVPHLGVEESGGVVGFQVAPLPGRSLGDANDAWPRSLRPLDGLV